MAKIGRNYLKTGFVFASIAFLAACDGTIHRQTDLGGVSVLSVDARQRIIVTGTRTEITPAVGDQPAIQFQRTVTCAEPSPDAIVAQASTLATSANSGEVNAAIAASLSESAGSIGLRTQSIQLLRDGYYRICEAYLNGAIGPTEYKQIVSAIDIFMIALVSIEAVTGVVVAPGVLLGSNGTGEIGENPKADSSAQAAKIVIENIESTTDKLSKEQVAAVINIVNQYYRKRP